MKSKNDKAELKIITNDKELDKAIELVYELRNAKKGSDEAKTRDVLHILIEKYEDEHHQMDFDLDPVEYIKIRMEDLGIKSVDFGKIIGSKSLASRILNYKRKLGLEHIRAISKSELRIPPRTLIQDYDLA